MVLCLLLTAADARADWRLSAGLEHFAWNEHTAPLKVSEDGVLPMLGLRLSEPFAKGFAGDYRGRVYFGSVTYHGSQLYQPTIPVTGTTHYTGTTQEAQLRVTLVGEVDVAAGLDLDFWHRKLGPDQAEDYRIVSMRFGAEHAYSALVPLAVATGVKFTLSTHEDAHFGELGFTENPPLVPERSVTPYLDLGYAFTPHWSIAGSFDGFSFGRSKEVALTQGNVQGIFYQPASDMRVFDLRLEYR